MFCLAPTYGGNADGAPCVLPFIYRNEQYSQCIPPTSKKPWCSTTANYDIDHTWGHGVTVHRRSKVNGLGYFARIVT